MLVALVALLAFAPQAGATDDEYESDEPVEACVAHDSEYEDSCSEDADRRRGRDRGTARARRRDDYEDSCSDEDEPEARAEGRARGGRAEGRVRRTRSRATTVLSRGPRIARRSTSAKFEDGCLPQFVRRFISRVWKFVGEVDYYEEGVLSMTMHKILNLPRKWRTQDDELIDEDTTVLVSERVRVFQDGERVGRDALEAANDVRVHGKLLRPFKWHEDEDGETVPTIRAKKVYITG